MRVLMGAVHLLRLEAITFQKTIQQHVMEVKQISPQQVEDIT